jgi:hypothetical protein
MMKGMGHEFRISARIRKSSIGQAFLAAGDRDRSKSTLRQGQTKPEVPSDVQKEPYLY